MVWQGVARCGSGAALLSPKQFNFVALKENNRAGAGADDHSQLFAGFRILLEMVEYTFEISDFRDRRNMQLLVAPGIEGKHQRPLMLRIEVGCEGLDILAQVSGKPIGERLSNEDVGASGIFGIQGKRKVRVPPAEEAQDGQEGIQQHRNEGILATAQLAKRVGECGNGCRRDGLFSL